MKILGRTLAILVAALAVCGAMVALVPAGAGEPPRAGFPARGTLAQGQPAAGDNLRPRGFDGAGQGRQFGRGEREGGRGPSLFGAGELLKSLGIIGVIVALGAPLASMLRRRKRRALAAVS